METVGLLREALADAHGYLERTIAGLDQAGLDWAPPGTANPIGATLAHVVVSEDVIVSAILAGGAPLMATAFAGRTGLSEPMPTPGPEWEGYARWARGLRVDLPAAMAYARATWVASDTYLAALAPADLDRQVDLTMLGRSHHTLGWTVLRLLVAHCDTMTGEIACLKGVQGRGGYG